MSLGWEALPTPFRTRARDPVHDASLGLAGGITVAAAVFGLITPGTAHGSVWRMMTGIVIGEFGLLLASRVLPHPHSKFREWGGHDGTGDADLALGASGWMWSVQHCTWLGSPAAKPEDLQIQPPTVNPNRRLNTPTDEDEPTWIPRSDGFAAAAVGHTRPQGVRPDRTNVMSQQDRSE